MDVRKRRRVRTHMASGLRRSLRARLMRSPWLVSVLLGVIVALTPLAHASPPDPSWIRGLYDDADFDDVIVLICAGAVAVGDLQTPGIPSPAASAALFLLLDDWISPADVLLHRHTRAPPLVSALP